eukprot:Blabericola_migrator_1__7384@NODE_375_length_9226_cov_181_823016_g131_i1_p7_GENE_NODE_375_length_9226_cov_181_823016_g131_i1NODE_375_length_9226_cov_181_823016_g131_i1_p7_ORF_typecomplete_len139_score17_21Ank_2/PF12796_7/1_7e09Ank_4/PF13637_6/0_027Ank_4/PF13637_6/2_4e06Ank_5/PF13857_6/0_82Ank_5/PF13857_6/1_2Ank_5/PF13857_6/0_00087Ank_3/PF13606_6/5e03Ank_3/PF13606_6/1_3e02Ank_3/PF13606_6/0_23Ank/PF00023_30/5_4e02Ank/PF00023_30/47Ank/PF00023_30/7_7_NODE_375_length_9226_cov_181_823016_g131_i119435
MRLVEGDKLIAALTNSWRDEAKRLLLEGWDVDIVDARTRTTPLLLATSLRDFEVVCLILYQSLESVNTKDKLSETALFKAVSRNDPKIAHVLLQADQPVFRSASSTRKNRCLFSQFTTYYLPSVLTSMLSAATQGIQL